MAFTNLDSLLVRKVEKEITDRLDELRDQLINGNAADMADYRFRCGQARALRDMQSWLRAAYRQEMGLEDKAS